MPSPSVAATSSPLYPNQSITATWANITAPAVTDFVAVYATHAAANGAYVARAAAGGASGSVDIPLPVASVAGVEYELRHFHAPLTLVATSSAFEVTALPDAVNSQYPLAVTVDVIDVNGVLQRLPAYSKAPAWAKGVLTTEMFLDSAGHPHANLPCPGKSQSAVVAASYRPPVPA